MAKREKPQPKSREEVIATLLRDDFLSEDEIAEVESIHAWKNEHKNGKVGRDYTFDDCAILTLLTLKAVFHLPLRATEGVTRRLCSWRTSACQFPIGSTVQVVHRD